MLNENLLIKDNVKNLRLLTEWVNRNDVIDAINGSDVVYIYYAGDNTVNRGFRTIEPYLLGVHESTGNLVLRAWQQAGASDTRKTAKRPNDEIPGWRLFRLDGITSFMKTFKTFDPINKPRPKFNPADKDMVNIIAVVNTTERDEFEVDGLRSIEQPNTIKKDVSIFDKQTNGFKFHDVNSELERKKIISDLYGLVKFHFKEDPLKYNVIMKNDRLWYDKKSNEHKRKPEEIVGNLNTLFREQSGAADTMKQTNKSFLENQYADFHKELQNT